MFFRPAVFLFFLAVAGAGCVAHDEMQWHSGTVDGAYFSCPAEQVFAPGALPDPESCFDGGYSSRWQGLSLEALRETAEYFARRNIHFALLLYPDPWETARAKLLGANTVPDSLLAAEVLRNSGIEVIAPWQEILDMPDGGLWFYYDIPCDPHPDVPVQKTAAHLLGEHLRRHIELPAGRHSDFSLSVRKSLAGRRHPESGIGIIDEIVLCKGEPPSFRHPASPVLIFGNSLCATPSGNELAARLGMELGFMPDCIRIDGGGLAKSMARYMAPGMDKEFAGRKAVILAMSANQLYERWLRPSVMMQAAEASAVQQVFLPEEWQKKFSAVYGSSGIMAFISRTWRSGDRLTPLEAEAVKMWRGASSELAEMEARKNGPPALYSWHDVPIPPGIGRVIELEIFTTAPPGYAEITFAGGDSSPYFTTVNTGEAEKIISPLPDGADRVTIQCRIALDECVFAAGRLTVSTLR